MNKPADDVLEAYLADNGWRVAFRDERAAKDADYSRFDDLGLGNYSLAALQEYTHGLYRHQKEAIQRYVSGANLAVTTSTASGKTLIFNICALEELSRRSSSRIAAIYPLKALATEQCERWRALTKKAGLSVNVGRIDGGGPNPRTASHIKRKSNRRNDARHNPRLAFFKCGSPCSS